MKRKTTNYINKSSWLKKKSKINKNEFKHLCSCSTVIIVKHKQENTYISKSIHRFLHLLFFKNYLIIAGIHFLNKEKENDKVRKSGSKYRIISNRIGTARDFKTFYTDLSKIQ